MKVEELRTLDAEELEGKLKDARRELYELRFKLAVGQLDNHRQIRQVRKDIAQILTIVHQRRWQGWEDLAETDVGTADVGARRASATDVGARRASPSSGESAEALEPEAEEPETVDSPEAVDDGGASAASPSEAEAPVRGAGKSRARKAGREENE
jgi:large subunit ribosomal protein L29